MCYFFSHFMMEQAMWKLFWGTATLALSVVGYHFFLKRREREDEEEGFAGAVGNTPLVKIGSLSRLLGCSVYGKCEFLNPGGSVKDRVAKSIIEMAEAKGVLKSGGTVYEGTSGSTGISLCLAAQQKGYHAVIYMPDDQAKEKSDIIRVLGGEVRLLRPVSIVDPDHICKAAKAAALADTSGNAFYADQFETEANFFAHFNGTGKEILRDLPNVSMFVASAGTGGTIGGTSARLKMEKGRGNVKCILADPPGSALASRVNSGILFNQLDKEGHRVKHPFDTITEGIGLGRLTENFKKALPFVDRAFSVSDAEAVQMAFFLLLREGLWVGSSSAVNCCAIVKAFKSGMVGEGEEVATILCDSGQRHLSKFWNPGYLKEKGLLPAWVDEKGQLKEGAEIPSPLDFVGA